MTDTSRGDAERAREVYGDRVVDKRLAMEQAFSRLPRYVTEYLLAKYVRPGHEQEDLEKVKARIRGRVPEADQKEVIKNRLMRDGRHVVLDHLEVEVDLERRRHWARVGCLDSQVAIDSTLVYELEALLNGGLWGTVTLAYRPEASAREKIGVVEFTPFQVSHVDMDGFKAGRRHFDRPAWQRLLLRSAGYEPGAVPSERVQWLLLARLIPLVERNVNLVELGPRGTGKTFLLRNLSPSVFTISGGRPTPAALFLNQATNRIGILGTRKVVVFDEIAATSFRTMELVATLKDYMESGQFSRGKRTLVSDASLVMAGNLETSAGRPDSQYTHLFEPFPVQLIDAAFLDRIHGYLPGWEIPKIRESSLAKGVGFVTDYFGEILKQLREDDVAHRFEGARFDTATLRDEKAARRLASGMLKLLYPDGECSDEELQACLRFGVELRQRVHNQLTRIAPGEFRRRSISFPGMKELGAPDLEESRRVEQRDARANREALVGHVSALAVVSRGDVDVGGDVFFIETSVLPTGSPGVSVTGMRGRVLQDSVRAAYQAALQIKEPWTTAAQRLQESKIAVHLVNIATPKDGPSAGIAFVTAMVSSVLGRPIRPGVAMTGEISLHGGVERVGGVTQKIEAAARHQRRLVIIPAQNAADLRDVADDILQELEIRTVDRIEDVLACVLEERPPSAGPSS